MQLRRNNVVNGSVRGTVQQNVKYTTAPPGRREPPTPYSKASPASSTISVMNWSKVMYKCVRAVLEVTSRSR